MSFYRCLLGDFLNFWGQNELGLWSLICHLFFLLPNLEGNEYYNLLFNISNLHELPTSSFEVYRLQRGVSCSPRCICPCLKLVSSRVSSSFRSNSLYLFTFSAVLKLEKCYLIESSGIHSAFEFLFSKHVMHTL